MKKLLIVEQEAVILEILDQRFLADGWTTACCSDGKTAMELMDSFQPNLMLTNILIPFYSGIELLQAARAKSNPIEVVMLALLIDDTVKKQCFEMGAAAYLTKPFDLEILLQELNKIAQTKQPVLH
jgi:two-component system, OmpR family, response regulator VicR